MATPPRSWDGQDGISDSPVAFESDDGNVEAPTNAFYFSPLPQAEGIKVGAEHSSVSLSRAYSSPPPEMPSVSTMNAAAEV